jgi:glycosyltransferase involved in cell wall biosynthesis
MSTVSVVIPCYRYGHYLEEAVSSVLDDQDGVDVRVLVIDDASGDGSAQVAEAIAARDPRVEVVAHSTNQGHIATYNEGLLGWADGDYTVLLSADDRLTPGALTRAVALLDAHPEVGFAYGNVLWFSDGSSLPRSRSTTRGWSVWPGHRWLQGRYRLAQSGISSPEVVVRTALQRRVGGYDPHFPHLGDTEMWLRLAAHADVGYLRGVDQAYYRRHPDNMSAAYTSLDTFEQYVSVFDSVLDRCRDTVPQPGHLADLAHRQLAREALLTAAQTYDRGRVDQVPVDELVGFALACWPEARSLPAYRSLRLRQGMGPYAWPYLRAATTAATVARRAEALWIRRGEQTPGDLGRRWWHKQRAARSQGALASANAMEVLP